MEIVQFDDRDLAHYSYAIISNGEIALIDPARDPRPYYDLAKQHNGKITAVIETHPHADFVSSHLEIKKATGAPIYVSALLNAGYEHIDFKESDEVAVGNIILKSLDTPGHSPDSICIVAISEQGKQEAVFTGDTLFIGDCGRPDLRETDGDINAMRAKLAADMYHSLRNKLMTLPNDVLVYPSHGAGSLCGKALSDKNSSTIGAEKATNWSLQQYTEEEFVKDLLADQPFVPKYFSYDVELNKKGAGNFLESMAAVKVNENIPELLEDIITIDTRNEELFKKGHFKNSVNLMDDSRFETWLGSIVAPHEEFYLIAESKQQLSSVIARVHKIGYEAQIKEAFAAAELSGETIGKLHVDDFRKRPEDFTIVDVRNFSEAKEKNYFKNALNIPLHQLRERATEIPTGKPVVVHCAGGYRSAAATSIINEVIGNDTDVFDLGVQIKSF